MVGKQEPNKPLHSTTAAHQNGAMEMPRNPRLFLLEVAVLIYYGGPLIACAVASLAFDGPTRWVICGLGFLWITGNVAAGLYRNDD